MRDGLAMTPDRYPILFGFREVIFGSGFIAGVEVHGRANAEQEAVGEWWVYGVTPGAIADTGSSLATAVVAFRQRMKAVLVDFAEEAADFEAFQGATMAFLAATDEEAQAEWNAAREAVRNGRLDQEDLPKVSNPEEPSFRVVRLREPKPSDNVVEREPPALAA